MQDIYTLVEFVDQFVMVSHEGELSALAVHTNIHTVNKCISALVDFCFRKELTNMAHF